MFIHAAILSRGFQVGSADGSSRKVFIIDEIGKMELFSQSFVRAVRKTLDSSSCAILGTIPTPKGKPLGLVEEVRSRRDVEVFTVSKNTGPVTGEKREIFRSVWELLSPTIAIGHSIHLV